MKSRTVKEIMLSIDDYAVVDEDATLLEAVKALSKAQSKLPPEKMKHRAVLIRDKRGIITGKLGHLAFLKALEPKYSSLGDMQTLSRAGLSQEFVSSMMDTYQFWGDTMEEICQRARSITIKDVLHPATEHISEDAPLSEAIHKFVMWQTLSILVTRGDEIVGILRLSDLYTEMEKVIENGCPYENDNR
jgi:CBS domain